jgi:hypothetical protein
MAGKLRDVTRFTRAPAQQTDMQQWMRIVVRKHTLGIGRHGCAAPTGGWFQAWPGPPDRVG